MEPVVLKIIMIGESGVGKTCLLKGHGKDDSREPYIITCKETVGTDFEKISIIIDKKEVTFHIWDTSGQERFRYLSQMFYNDVHGAVLVYDITRRETFDQVPKWWNDIRSYAKDNTDILLVGNKIDLEGREIQRIQGLKFATQRKAQFIETTAITGVAISHVLEKIARKILTHHESYQKPDLTRLSPNTYDSSTTTKRSFFEKWFW